MLDFEKLGAFYLGNRIDPVTDSATSDLVLYDSRDLTTHAVIIGMTGSGKTGLGIGLLEEAALDHIPVIAIDPKGDMGNLMLAFPDFGTADFEPWVNPRQAADRGQTVQEFAAAQAALWKKGLTDSGQDGERIRKLKNSAEFSIYTPGSEAGLPVSLLKSFAAPAAALRADGDLYRERVQATATGILSLIGIEADPITSREHILIVLILDHHWQQGQGLDLAALIGAIQSPPVSKVGVMDIDAFYPAKDRFALAMRLNNLLASPGFEAWLHGAPLDAQSLLYTNGGKPRVSILSIAHLDDAARMFFVTMLLNEIIAWMRSQQGTSSLRAILYMDEIFGYLPPVSNPPTKNLFLTLLKQARAYGLGLVLATQNPVDLDYKALSNAGTWFIGRLQTERDKARVMEGLEGASQGATFDKPRMERTLAGLGKRRFLLHNVHEDEAVVFGTRWVMSYLAGPMTRDQIRRLMQGRQVPGEAAEAVAQEPKAAGGIANTAPILAPGIRQFFVPASGEGFVYYPRLVGAAAITITNARHKVDEAIERVYTLQPADGSVAIRWDDAERLPLPAGSLEASGIAGARYADCGPELSAADNYAGWEKLFTRWLRLNESVQLFHSRKYKLSSHPDETEGEFRVRLQQVVSEQRDRAAAALRKRYAGKVTTLENRLLRAQQAVDREAQQSSKKKVDTVLSFGTAILGALLGRKRLSASTASRVGTAIRSAGSARKEAGDVKRARETLAKVQEDLEALNEELEREVEKLDDTHDAQHEVLEEVVLKPRAGDVHVRLFGLAWVAYRDNGAGRMQQAW